MADQPKRWIVLLNKVPRGPLTVDQIRALIKEGLLRHNDIAFEASPPGTDPDQKKNFEWKLLWQFPEFDRRLEKDKGEMPPDAKPTWSGTSTPAAAKVEPERRRQITPVEVDVITREKLPIELLDIPPEDLLVHSTAQEAVELGEIPRDEPKAFKLNAPSRRAMLAGAGALALTVFAWMFWPAAGPLRRSISTPSVESVAAVPEGTRTRPAGGKPPAARVMSRPSDSLVAPQVPEARVPASGGNLEDLFPTDRGEIDSDDEPDEGVQLEEGGDDEPPATGKIRRPTGNKRSRVLTDERAEPDEGGDDSPSAPAPAPAANDDEPPSDE